MSPSWFRRSPEPDANEERVWQRRRTALWRLLAVMGKYASILGLVCLILILLGGFALLIWQLLRRPERSPVLAIQTVPYEWPLPPNAWAAEDIQNLAALQEAGTISLVDPWRKARGRDDLFEMVSRAVDPYAKQGDWLAAIFYVSMHGVVEGDTPYLIPPGGSPSEPQTWIKVDELVDRISQLYSQKNKLLVLDCNRMPANWHLGLASNDFSTGLRDWWNQRDKDKYSRVAVLNSAGPGQQGWASTTLRGSVFGHYFRLGLAGAADGVLAGERGDKSVSVKELNQYLTDHVGTWVRRRYGDLQVPMMLLPGDQDDDDFPVVAALHGRSLRMFQDQETRRAAGGASVSSADLDNIWQRMDDLRSFAVYGREPLEWRALEQQILWLEQLAQSGTSYEAMARQLAEQLTARTEAIRARLVTARNSRRLADYEGVIRGDAPTVPEGLQLSSLALAQSLAAIDAKLGLDLDDAIGTFRAAPNQDSLTQTLAQLQQLGGPDLAQHHFLRMLQRYQVPRLWQQSAVLSDLLRLDQRAEALGVPSPWGGGDERIHSWVRPLLADADAVRRQAVDQMFLDGPSTLQATLSSADTKYGEAEQAARGLTAAVQLRDQACAEIPYFCQWLADPLRATGDSSADSQTISQVLLPLMRDTSQLGQLIASGPTLADGPAAQAIAQVAEVKAAMQQTVEVGQRVRQNLESLHQTLRRECESLVAGRLAGDDDANHFRRIVVALRNPLLPSKLRQDLRERMEEIAERLRNKVVVPGEPASTVADGREDSPKGSQSLGQDLLQNFLDIALPGTGEAASGEAQTVSIQWREQIRKLLDDIADLQGTYQQLTPADTRDDREVRRGWSDLEQRLRRVAPFWLPRQPAVDPVRVLHGIDLRAVLVWHGQRALDDFWGAAGQAQPFFETATVGYLQSARQWLNTYRSSSMAALESRLSTDRRAATDWLQTKPASAVLLSRDDAVKVPITVSANAASAAELPSGTATLLQRRDSIRVPAAGFGQGGALQIPAGGTLPLTVLGEAVWPHEQQLDIQTMFRGHEFPAVVNVKRLGGVTVAYQPYVYEQSRVTLHNPWTELSTVFVLDCSGSMNTPMEGQSTRLQVAKEALRQLLDELGGRRNVRVGMRFFGHRLGWTTDRPVRLLTSPTYPRDLPAGLRPDDDVERILPLSDFNYDVARGLYQELDAVTAWGQSPLNLSLDLALAEDFVGEQAAAGRHIVVLTDGRDYQYRPLVDNQRSVDQVVRRARQAGVPIHLLGLAMNGDERGEVATEFAQIASQTGGLYRNLTTSTDLISALRSIFAPDMYQLRDASGRLIGEGPLGTSLVETRVPPTPRPYTLEFPGGRETLWLEGGEAISLFGLPHGSQVYAFPYDHDVSQTLPLLRSTTPPVGTGHMLRVHRPIRSDRDVQFPLSIQRLDGDSSSSADPRWRWTRRPSEVWVEITPYRAQSPPEAPDDPRRTLFSGPAGQTYIFYDANYEPDRPVPELQLMARDWPAGAAAARLQVWFKPGNSAAPTRVPLASVMDSPGTRIVVPSAGVPGVQLEIDAGPLPGASDWFRLRVIERHGPGSAGVSGLKVLAPEGTAVRPERITRQFDAQNGLAVHFFDYRRTDELSRDLRQAAVGLLAREAALRDSWQPAGELIFVLIREAGHFIPLATR